MQDTFESRFRELTERTKQQIADTDRWLNERRKRLGNDIGAEPAVDQLPPQSAKPVISAPTAIDALNAAFDLLEHPAERCPDCGMILSHCDCGDILGAADPKFDWYSDALERLERMTFTVREHPERLDNDQ